MRFYVSAVLAVGIIVLMLASGCADVTAKQKVGDFGTAFGATADEQKAIDWFKATYGDPTTNNDKPARFVEPMITSGLSDKNLPKDKVTTFPVSGGSIYFFVIYDNFKKGDPIEVSWTYLENGKVVTTVKQQAGGDFGRFIVEFQKPDSGWGKGKQRITVTGDGATASVDFVIGDALQTTPLPYNPTAGQTTGKDTLTTTIAPTRTPLQGSDCNITRGAGMCDGHTCTYLMADNANCGACGFPCPEGLTCSQGKCRDNKGLVTCPSGEADCGGVCAELKTNPYHCGTCETRCTSGQTCVEGVCTSGLATTFTTVTTGGQASGVATCPAGQTLCNNMCTDLQSDKDNCGACGVKAGARYNCEGGRLCWYDDAPCIGCPLGETGTPQKHCVGDGTY
jgi:hypothetical protein